MTRLIGARDWRVHVLAGYGRTLCGLPVEMARDGAEHEAATPDPTRPGCVACGDGIEPRAGVWLRLPGGQEGATG
jgi:hypothetical protein